MSAFRAKLPLLQFKTYYISCLLDLQTGIFPVVWRIFKPSWEQLKVHNVYVHWFKAHNETLCDSRKIRLWNLIDCTYFYQFICQKNRDPKLWQHIYSEVCGIFQRYWLHLKAKVVYFHWLKAYVWTQVISGGFGECPSDRTVCKNGPGRRGALKQQKLLRSDENWIWKWGLDP
jgi:hypothetical protein